MRKVVQAISCLRPGTIRRLHGWTLSLICASALFGFSNCAGDGAPQDPTDNGDKTTVESIAPSSAVRGTTPVAVNVVISGHHFQSDAARIIVNGAGITVTNGVRLDDTIVFATFTVAPNAVLGPHTVTAGNSNQFTFTVLSAATAGAPSLTGITPNTSGLTAQRLSVRISGAGFVAGDVVSMDGTGISVLTGPVTNASFIDATLIFAGTQSLGIHNVIVTRAGVSSNPVAFIIRNPHRLASITPSSGAQGILSARTVHVTLEGSGLATATRIDISGTGVVSSIPHYDASTGKLTADFSITTRAAIGHRDVTVITPTGTSNSVKFNVISPVTPVNPGQR